MKRSRLLFLAVWAPTFLGATLTDALSADVDLTAPDGVVVARLEVSGAADLVSVDDYNLDGRGDLARTSNPSTASACLNVFYGQSAYLASQAITADRVLCLDSRGPVIAGVKHCRPSGGLGALFNGGFMTNAEIRLDPPELQYGTRLVSGGGTFVRDVRDFNGDGSHEIWFGGIPGNKGCLMEGRRPDAGGANLCCSQCTNFCSGTGYGEIRRPAGLSERAFPLGDINGDGKNELGLVSGSETFHVVYGVSGLPSIPDLDQISGDQGYRVPRPSNIQGALLDAAAGMDLDGDGVGDLAISYAGVMDRGAVVVIYGVYGSRGSVFDVDESEPDTYSMIDGSSDGDRFGTALASLQDINRDGRNDLAIGTLGTTHYLLKGSQERLPTGSDTGLAGVALTVTGPDSTSTKLIGDSDFNGDGREDLYMNLGANSAWILLNASPSAIAGELFRDGFEGEPTPPIIAD